MSSEKAQGPLRVENDQQNGSYKCKWKCNVIKKIRAFLHMNKIIT